MEKTLSIAVTGSGIAGLASALFLSRAGHQVTIIERFKTPQPIGSGLVIQPVGQNVLAKLGLLDNVIKQGQKIYNMSGIDSRTRKSVLNVAYGPNDGERFGLAIHRATLFDCLYTAAKTTPHIKFQNNHQVISSHTTPEGRFVNTNKKVFGPYDLVIDATGAHSPLSPIHTKALGYGALWGTVDWPQATTLPTNKLSQCYQNASHMMGVLPLGTLPNDRYPKAAIFWSEPRQNLPHFNPKDFPLWQERTIDLWPEFEPFIRQLNNPTQLTPAIYSHGTLGKPYMKRLVFIGDSAHQASPQLGQGANMALLDADALQNALIKNELKKALKIYAHRRRIHIWLYQFISAIFTPFYQSNSKVLPFFRNHVMNPLSYIWPVKPLLTKLVCGTLVNPNT